MKDSPSKLLDFSPLSEQSQLVLEEESNLDNDGRRFGSRCRRCCPRALVVFIVLYVVLLVFFLSVAVLLKRRTPHPHLIVVVVDDLGWGDVEWNDPDMRTPVLNDLKSRGVLLNNSYVHPLDSPSRASMFTGLYPFHMGLQHETMLPDTPAFLPENVTLLPAHLQTLGYKTHLVGKWHLGFCDWRFTPQKRGFHTFSGFYTDGLDYYTHRDRRGFYDYRAGEMVDDHAEGIHSTRLVADRAKAVIFNHDSATPLFLVLAFQAVHSPAQVPQKYLNETCGHVADSARQTICALVAMVDEAIGNVTSMLRDMDMLSSSVIIVTSDNGGVTKYGSSNGPFRGGHGELYEGGTRVLSLISGSSLSGQADSTYSGLFHQVDWFPTITSILGEHFVDGLDGFNHWLAITSGTQSPRNELVYNIDDEYKNSAIRIDEHKLILGAPNYTQPDHARKDEVRLYDLTLDPGEVNNLADSLPNKVDYYRTRLHQLRKGLVPAKDRKASAKADPALWNNVWTPGWC